MSTAEREIAVIVRDPEVERSLPRTRFVKRFKEPDTKLLENWTNIFVSVSLFELPRMADFIREANDRHYLKGLFVRDEFNTHLLPQMLNLARLRTLRNLLVHSGPEIPARVINAYLLGAEDDLIAEAKFLDDSLVVVTCAGAALPVKIQDIPRLSNLPRARQLQYELADDGAYIYWEPIDLHLDLEDIRLINGDEELSARTRAKRLAHDRRIGLAISTLRQEAGLRQTDIEGLSERQVRRYEHGERPSFSAFETLAEAHRLSLQSYLDRLAETIALSAGGPADQDN